MYCSYCGTELAADSSLCPKCGKPITSQAHVTAPSPVPDTIGSPSTSQMGYIVRAWNGEERLWKIFWLNIVLGSILFRFLGALVQSFLLATNIPVGWNIFRIIFVAFLLVFLLLLVIYFVWALVALWKCAFNAEWKGWGYLGRAFVVWSVISFFGSLIFFFWNISK